MLGALASVLSLLLGIGILLVGSGLLGSLLGIRAGLEQFPGSVIGLVMSAYFLGFVAGTFLCPPLIRRVGHIRAFAVMAAVASSAAIAHALWVDPFIWGLLRIITGICLVGLYMVIESWLNVLAPRERRARFFGAYVAVTLFAMAAGQLLLLGGDPARFELFALVTILFSLGLVPVALTRVAQPAPVETAGLLSLRRLGAISPLGLAGVAASGLANGAFWGMGAVFAQRAGLSETGVVAFLGATIAGGALLQWPLGHLSDRYDRRSVLTGVGFAAAAMALLLALALHWSVTALVACSFVLGGLMFTVYGLGVAHTNDHLAPEQVLEATRGLLLLHGLGATIGPTAAGLLMQTLGPQALPGWFALVLGGLGLFGLWRMRRSPPVPAEQQEPFVPAVRTSPVALEMDPRVPEG